MTAHPTLYLEAEPLSVRPPSTPGARRVATPGPTPRPVRLTTAAATPDTQPVWRATALLVSADEQRRQSLAHDLDARAVKLFTASSYDEALQEAERKEFDAIVIDGALPGHQALDLCRDLSDRGSPPLLVLSHSDERLERLLILELGGDQCLDAGCSDRELAAHIRSARRRVEWARRAARRRMPVFYFADWSLDVRRRLLTAPNGRSAAPPEQMLSTLVAFLEHPGLILSIDRLQKLTGSITPPEFQMNDWRMRVCRLRRLLRRLDADFNLIATCTKRGYLLRCEVEIAFE